MSSTFSPSLDAAAGGDLDAEHGLLAVVVHALVEDEGAAALRLEDGPAGEAARRFGDVLLGVAAVHAERVQFQQFAAVVFVEAARALLAARLRSVRAHGLPVVQVEQHRRTLGGGFQQVFELAEDVRADHVALVFGDQVAVGALIEVDVEVVEPEIGQHFVELAVAVDGAQQLAFGEIAGDHLLRTVGHLDAAAQLGRCDGEQSLAHARGHGGDHVVLLFLGERLEGGQALLRRALAAARGSARGVSSSVSAFASRHRLGGAAASPPAACFSSYFATSLVSISLRSGSVGNGTLAVDHLLDHLRRRVVAHQFARPTSAACRASSAFRRAPGSRRCFPGWSCRSIHFFRPIAFTSWASPGRGPKVRRLSACRIF